ncbi:MAG: hypothetical protein ACON4R_09690 [Akkermansiaceae bacterium]
MYRKQLVATSDKEVQTIEVWSDEASQPVAVCYAILKLLLGSLMNEREFLAYLPRTNTWQL